ncbi:PREDICTED: uncharacterized protein LOC108361859 [Rhagoletis zephyria]|uniref:uncharacterized protein LOC108361859 n=1 Tax=Rhagoletis zephyria TaxID=28612 RepID=UPI0008119CEC|nr:PREDICTED: uncharacterized protein LOC108361859 [Rhagoletis zephyria]
MKIISITSGCHTARISLKSREYNKVKKKTAITAANTLLQYVTATTPAPEAAPATILVNIFKIQRYASNNRRSTKLLKAAIKPQSLGNSDRLMQQEQLKSMNSWQNTSCAILF